MVSVNKVFPRLQEKAREQLAMNIYIFGPIARSILKFSLGLSMQRRPLKLSEAVAATIEPAGV